MCKDTIDFIGFFCSLYYIVSVKTQHRKGDSNMQTALIHNLKVEIVELANVVRDNFLLAVQAFENKNSELAKEVIVRDEKANTLTDKISKQNLSLIALQAPVATDLRTLGAYLKIVTDLERIGDLAVNIAKAVVRLDNTDKTLPFFDIINMANEVKHILDIVIQSFISEDIKNVRSLNEMDDVIDSLHRKNVEMIESALEKEPGHFKEAIQYIKLLHALERIGDHATNIGEWTVYMKTGNIADLNH
jgi:phosphate transport system protein